MNKTALLYSALLVASVVSAVEYRALGTNDVSYYRIGGKGETFVTPLVYVTTNEVQRKAFWTRVEKAGVPEIYQLQFRHPKGSKYKHFPDADECIRQIDAWFADGEDFKPCPEKIFAVSLEEENITWAGQIPIMNAMARHLKEKYGVRTYHWLTEPLKPTLALEGDGWIFDAYSIVDPESFYAHVESFILTGLPVVPCIWGAGHFDGYHQGKTWYELTRFTLDRFEICRSLGLPIQVFAVTGKQGSVLAWFGKAESAGEQFYRDTIKGYLESAKRGAESSWKKPAKRWCVNIARSGRVEASVNLKDFELVRETRFDDARNWKLTRNGLVLLANGGTLEWCLKPSGDVTEGEFTLRHSKNAKGTFGGVALSADGVTRVKTSAFRERAIVLVAEGEIVLESISFSGKGTFIEDVVEPTMDDSDGHTDYQARRDYANDPEWGLKSSKGYVATKRLVQKLAIPGCRGKLTVTGDVMALKSYGASVELALSLDGVNALTNVATIASNAIQQVQAVCDIPTGTREAYCLWNLKVDNGAEVPSAPRAEIRSVHYRLKPLLPK